MILLVVLLLRYSCYSYALGKYRNRRFLFVDIHGPPSNMLVDGLVLIRQGAFGLIILVLVCRVP